MGNKFIAFKEAKPKQMEFIRFLITGAVSTLITYLVYYLCLRFASPSISFTLGYAIALVVNYVMTTHFTFKVKASAKNGLGFIVSNLINYFLCIAVLNVFIWVGVNSKIAPIPMYCIAVPTNFILVRLVMKSNLFNGKKTPIRGLERFLFIGGLLLICLYYLPYLLMGEDAYILIHDNMDLTVANLKMLKDGGLSWSFFGDLIPVGEHFTTDYIQFRLLPRTLIVEMFSPFTAYLVNEWVCRILGFIGMWLLLSGYCLKKSSHKWTVTFVVSTLFALMGFYADYGLSVMGQPLLAYAFLNLLNRIRLVLSYGLIAFVAFYSQIVQAGVFECLVLGIIVVYFWLKEKKIDWFLFGGLMLLGIVYLLTNVSLLVNTLYSNPVSNRLEYVNDMSFHEVIAYTIGLVVTTFYHAGSWPTYLIVFLSILYLVCFRRYSVSIKCMIFALVSIVLFCFFFKLAKMIMPESKLLNLFQFDRIYFLMPFFWAMLLAYLLDGFVGKRWGRYVVGPFVLIFVAKMFLMNSEYRLNLSRLIVSDQEYMNTMPSYRQFFDESLFNNIARSIGEAPKDVKVLSLGMFPSVAQYNGFHTLDGYFPSYPLEYKHRFRNIMDGELSKNERIKSYFDNWGNRCYLFSVELGQNYLYSKYCEKSIEHLDINTEALKALGCNYIFSAVDIKNYQSLGLDFQGSYTTPSSFWNVRVYKILS